MIAVPCSTVEYGLFNLLPEGKTIEQIPMRLRWLYIYPIRTDPSYKKLERIRDGINHDRSRGDYQGEVKTPCEIRERTVTYSGWREYEE